MIYTSIFVPDHDAAIAFYVHTLGFELMADQSMPGFRWVVVAPKGQTDTQLLLYKPTAGSKLSPDDVDSIFALMKKGAFGAGVFETADCHGTYEELKGKGVEFLSPPKEQFYGTEALLRDPFGNWFSLTQRK
jgi:catechol 2,3-dioxygenase-like lactoylglutathione lyase family enzyme